jgi:hypothetical protein
LPIGSTYTGVRQAKQSFLVTVESGNSPCRACLAKSIWKVMMLKILADTAAVAAAPANLRKME